MTKKIQQYFDLMREVEENLLTYIEKCNEDNDDIINYLEEQKIKESKHKFKSFLHLIAQLSNNYHRTGSLYNKIDHIISHFKDSIQKYFINSEIFHIFQNNKRILLFLIQQKILTINQSIFDIFNQTKFIERYYLEYFFPEIESFLQEPLKTTLKKKVKELNENNLELFNEKRNQGENDHILCLYIRNDQVIDFITYLEKNNISPTSEITESIYETNPLLLKYNITEEKFPYIYRYNSKTLIEYSAFFGSQQILVYLVRRGVKMTSSIWPYIIHGKNSELIHYLEENKVYTLEKSYQYLIVESIKCHHNEIADYLLMNVSHKEHIYKKYLLKKRLKYYNYNLKKLKIQNIIHLSLKSDLFYFLCKYDYYLVVQFLLTIPELNVNQQYKIFKPHIEQDEIVLSIDIKNGKLKKIPEEKKLMSDNKPPDNGEYDDENNYNVYNYLLYITSALLISAQKGNIDIIQLLLNSNKIVSKIKSKKYHKRWYFHDYQFFTIIEEKALLHEAIENGHADVVRILLSSGKFNVNDNLIKCERFIDTHSTAFTTIWNEYHITPLLLASELGYSEIMQILLSQGKADINQKSCSVEYENGGCEYKINTVIRKEKTALHVAIQKKNLNIIKICLKQPNIDINVPYLIIDLGNLRTTQYKDYFDAPCNNEIKFPVLNWALYEDNADAIRLLLNHPNIDRQEIENIKPLLQKKAIDINVLDEKK